MGFRHYAALAAAVLLMGTAAANAASYNVTVSEGLSGGFDTTAGNPFSGNNTASASFVYSGALNFSNTAAFQANPGGDLNSAFFTTPGNISGYSGSGSVTYNSTPVANYGTLAGFLASSGSGSASSSMVYGSYYTFDLGTIAAGTVLTITHDDGVSLYQGATRVGSTSSAKTVAVTESVTVGTSGDVILRYARENSSPSILQVSVPEPASLALLGAGLVGLGAIRRRRRSTRA